MRRGVVGVSPAEGVAEDRASGLERGGDFPRSANFSNPAFKERISMTADSVEMTMRNLPRHYFFSSFFKMRF